MKSPVRKCSLRILEKVDATRRSVAANQSPDIFTSSLTTIGDVKKHIALSFEEAFTFAPLSTFKVAQNWKSEIILLANSLPIKSFKICNWIQCFQGNFYSLMKLIFTSIRSKFNSQNCRIWAARNPQIIKEKPLHSRKRTVCCGIWASGGIRSYILRMVMEMFSVQTAMNIGAW